MSGLGGSQETVRYVACINVVSGDRIGRVVGKRDSALEWACARARSIERGHTAIWSAQESVRHIASVNGSCRDGPCGVKAKAGKNKGALAGACAGVWSIKRSEGAVRSAQEAVSYIARVNV